MQTAELSPEAIAIKEEIEFNGGSFLPNEQPIREVKPASPISDKPRFIAPDDPKDLIKLEQNNVALNEMGEAIKKQCTISACKQFIDRTDEAAIASLEKYIQIQKKFLAKAIIESLIGPLEMLVSSPEVANQKIQLFIDSCKIKKPELIVELIKQCLPRENVQEQQKGTPSTQSFAPIIINNNIPQAEPKSFKDNIIEAA